MHQHQGHSKICAPKSPDITHPCMDQNTKIGERLPKALSCDMKESDSRGVEMFKRYWQPYMDKHLNVYSFKASPNMAQKIK